MRYLLLLYYRKANGQFDESMAITKNVKTRDLQEASVILDFKRQQVVKATLGGDAVPKDWDTVVAYYYQHYKATIERLFVENGHPLPETAEEESVETTEEPIAIAVE